MCGFHSDENLDCGILWYTYRRLRMFRKYASIYTIEDGGEYFLLNAEYHPQRYTSAQIRNTQSIFYVIFNIIFERNIVGLIARM